MCIGKRIFKLRQERNLTQQKLADYLFVTDKTISSWESNRTEPNLEMIVKLSEVLECSISYLVYGDTNKNNIETEIKIKISLDEYKRISHFMKNNALFLKENRQIDTYYQPTYRKFLKNQDEEIEEWLRIGLRGNKKILNYKNWHDNMYCDEYEVELDDEKNLDKIFKVLGLEQIAVVDKKRVMYCYLDKYEVSIDFVVDLGYFIEIEVKKYSLSFTDEYDLLIKTAKDLGLNLNNIDKRGYPYYLIYNK